MIAFEVLGAPGRDNAVFARVETGQAIYRLQFDCGEGCLPGPASAKAIDHLFFSHLHMDHVGGFDALFRLTYNRARVMHVYGPPETARIMHHRFRGFMWNVYGGQPGIWQVHDVYPDRLESFSFRADEAFAHAYPVKTRGFDGVVIDHPDFTVSALHLNHLTPSLGYIVRERPRLNIDTDKLTSLGLRPGSWLQKVKARDDAMIDIEGTMYRLAELRRALLTPSPGDSLAYLTDFLLDEESKERLVKALEGCATVICESQYRHGDLELARQNYHLAATQAAEIAREANARQLVLFHLSERYRLPDWLEMIAEARAIFPNTHFPQGWQR